MFDKFCAFIAKNRISVTFAIGGADGCLVVWLYVRNFAENLKFIA